MCLIISMYVYIYMYMYMYIYIYIWHVCTHCLLMWLINMRLLSVGLFIYFCVSLCPRISSSALPHGLDFSWKFTGLPVNVYSNRCGKPHRFSQNHLWMVAFPHVYVRFQQGNMNTQPNQVSFSKIQNVPTCPESFSCKPAATSTPA